MTESAKPRSQLNYYIQALIKYSASDLHLKPGRPPLYRVHGKMIPSKMPDLIEGDTERLLSEYLTPKLMAILQEKRQVDFSFKLGDLGRYRCNAFYQKGVLSAAIRAIPMNVPHLNQLGLPLEVIKELCQRPRGLILVTGATGSGKSTTLASMVQFLNETSPAHILTIEDPIEFVYSDAKASVTQREVGSDVQSMEDGLIAGLRQDPDVIMIGEIRDLETIQAALTAAETGHLILTTLHTNDAKSSIDRILDVFEAESRNQVRIQLASSLLGVISQQLVPKADGSGVVPACEVMVKSPAIESYILQNELDKIPEAIATSNSYYKMQTMNQALVALVSAGHLKLEDAVRFSNNPDDLKLILSGVDRGSNYG